jgi:hypothetical protein
MSEVMGHDWCPDDSEAVYKILGISVKKSGPGHQKGDALAAVPGLEKTTPGGTASEVSRVSHHSQHSAVKV